jgi:hypothetical protein
MFCSACHKRVELCLCIGGPTRYSPKRKILGSDRPLSPVLLQQGEQQRRRQRRPRDLRDLRRVEQNNRRLFEAPWCPNGSLDTTQGKGQWCDDPEPVTEGSGFLEVRIDTYIPLQGVLFPHKPTIGDIGQGHIGNRLLLATLTVMLSQEHGDAIIMGMMCDHGDGTVSVRLYAEDDLERPVMLHMKKTVARVVTRDRVYHSSGPPWVQLVEKAMSMLGNTGPLDDSPSTTPLVMPSRPDVMDEIKGRTSSIQIESDDLPFREQMLVYLEALANTPLGHALLTDLATMGAQTSCPVIKIVPGDEYRTVTFDATETVNAGEFAQLKAIEKDIRLKRMALGFARVMKKERIPVLEQEIGELDRQAIPLMRSLYDRNEQERMYEGGAQHGVTIFVEPKAAKDEYALDKAEVSTGWHTARQQFGLYHELIHAYHILKGDQAKGQQAGVGNPEWQVLGFGPYQDEQYTEQTLRAAMGKPPRPHYDKHYYS